MPRNPRRSWTAVIILVITLMLLGSPLIVVTVLYWMGVKP